MSRTKNSFRNMTVDLGGHVLKLLVQFWCRRAFVLLLGEVYLGLLGLFSNVLLLLSFAELGIGSAISFSLYKPLAEHDTETIKSLMRFFKRAYLVIAALVALIGTALTPFLPYLIPDMPDIEGVRLIYLLYLLNTVISYLFTYKRTLIIADQKEYIISATMYATTTLLSVVQLVLLYITKNFILYLCALILFTVIENVLIARRADKLYPYLKDKNIKPIPEQEMGVIKKNVGALIFHQVGSVIVFGTDNILIVRLVDLVSAGIYANYTMVKNALNNILGAVYKAMFASFGNLGVTSDDETKRMVFDRIRFMSNWLYSFCFVCLFCLFNPFITLWVGKQFTFPMGVVFVICLEFFVTGMRKSVNVAKNSMGLYWSDRYRPLIESLINLVVSIVLGIRIGILGILIGTVVSSVTTNLWIEPWVLYKHGLHAPVREYFRDYALTVLLTAVAAAACWFLCQLVPGAGIAAFILRMLICLVIPNAIWLLVKIKSPHLSYFIQLFKKIVTHKLA